MLAKLLVATVIVVVRRIGAVDLLNAIKDKTYYVFAAKKCNCILDGLCRGGSCSGYHQAAIYVLSKCYGITQRKNGRRIDYNPVELRRELLKESSEFLRLQQFCRTAYGELTRR